ncbi:MAG: cache domain-containing protein, partial [Halanaerobiales bacterium]|nr:cache domain-containing protein [Halanaerobiales bacterium]
MFKFKSIKYKLLIAVSLVILVVIFFSSYLYYKNSKTILQNILIKEAETSTTENAKNINQWINEKKVLLETMTNINSVQGLNWLSAQLILRRTQENTNFMDLMLVEKNGRYKAISGSLGDISEKKYFKEALEKQTTVLSNVYVDYFTQKMVFAAAAPITDDYDKLQGFLVGVIELENVQKLISDLNLNGSGYAMIFNQDLKLLAHPKKEMIGSSDFYNNSQADFKKVLDKIIKNNFFT